MTKIRKLIRQEIRQLIEDNDPCWKGYQQIGMKDKDGRQVPNCVPESTGVNELQKMRPAVKKLDN